MTAERQVQREGGAPALGRENQGPAARRAEVTLMGSPREAEMYCLPVLEAENKVWAWWAPSEGCGGRVCSSFLPGSGRFLAVLGFPWLVEATLTHLHRSPCVCASVSQFPLFIKTLVVFD